MKLGVQSWHLLTSRNFGVWSRQPIRETVWIRWCRDVQYTDETKFRRFGLVHPSNLKHITITKKIGWLYMILLMGPWNPANHLGWCWNPISNGIKYQLQLVQGFSHQQYFGYLMEHGCFSIHVEWNTVGLRLSINWNWDYEIVVILNKNHCQWKPSKNHISIHVIYIYIYIRITQVYVYTQVNPTPWDPITFSEWFPGTSIPCVSFRWLYTPSSSSDIRWARIPRDFFQKSSPHLDVPGS